MNDTVFVLTSVTRFYNPVRNQRTKRTSILGVTVSADAAKQCLTEYLKEASNIKRTGTWEPISTGSDDWQAKGRESYSPTTFYITEWPIEGLS